MQIEIPKFLSHLKTDERGYPIPFFVAYVNGVPDFRMLSEEKQIRCMEKKLCSVCGKKLFEYFYFITGPRGLENGTHSDPPMHRDCAEYSLKMCPHLYYQRATINDREDYYKERRARNEVGIQTKPNEIFLIKADKCKLTPVPGYGNILKFRKVSFRKFIYTNGILSEFTVI